LLYWLLFVCVCGCSNMKICMLICENKKWGTKERSSDIADYIQRYVTPSDAWRVARRDPIILPYMSPICGSPTPPRRREKMGNNATRSHTHTHTHTMPTRQPHIPGITHSHYVRSVTEITAAHALFLSHGAHRCLVIANFYATKKLKTLPSVCVYVSAVKR